MRKTGRVEVNSNVKEKNKKSGLVLLISNMPKPCSRTVIISDAPKTLTP